MLVLNGVGQMHSQVNYLTEKNLFLITKIDE